MINFGLIKTVAVVSVAVAGTWGFCARATVATLPANGLTPTSVTLNGVANPQSENGLVWFEWGTNTNHDQITATQPLAAGTNDQQFSHVLNGLSIGATYSFRAVVSNSLGIVYGTNQTFVTLSFVAATELWGAYEGSVGWGDFDNDGRLDILLSGHLLVQVWRNTETGFPNINANLPSTSTPIASWVDLDNDGRLDVGLAGGNWRNTGTGFTNVDPALAVSYIESAVYGDFDNDGRSDVLLTGYADDTTTQIWRNTGGRFQNANVDLPGFHFGTVAWGDYDADGRLDFLVCGEMNHPEFGFRTQLWRNTGNGFTNVNAGLPGIDFGSLAWGDYDNDGRLDLVLIGYAGQQPLTQVWRNTGDGFTNINAGLPELGEGSVAWGDYDNDGRLDLLLTGHSAWWSGEFISDVWRNTTNGFVRVNAGLMPTCRGGTAWGDYDNDGRLDILLTGLTNSDNSWYQYSQVFHNEYPVTNTPPSPPANLTSILDGNDVVFSWGSGSDAETPAAGLTYNLRVGTSPGGVDLIAPMSLSNGFRQVARMGNVQKAHQFKLVGAPLNQPIYWSVQSVDTTFAGSTFAPEKDFRVHAMSGFPPGPVAGDLNGDGLVNQADLSAMLQVFLVSNPPPIFNVSAPVTNRFQFGLPMLARLDFTVMASADLVNWESNGPALLYFDFFDPDATNHVERYYQLQSP